MASSRVSRTDTNKTEAVLKWHFLAFTDTVWKYIHDGGCQRDDDDAAITLNIHDHLVAFWDSLKAAHPTVIDLIPMSVRETTNAGIIEPLATSLMDIMRKFHNLSEDGKRLELLAPYSSDEEDDEDENTTHKNDNNGGDPDTDQARQLQHGRLNRSFWPHPMRWHKHNGTCFKKRTHNRKNDHSSASPKEPASSGDDNEAPSLKPLPPLRKLTAADFERLERLAAKKPAPTSAAAHHSRSREAMFNDSVSSVSIFSTAASKVSDKVPDKVVADKVADKVVVAKVVVDKVVVAKVVADKVSDKVVVAKVVVSKVVVAKVVAAIEEAVADVDKAVDAKDDKEKATVPLKKITLPLLSEDANVDLLHCESSSSSSHKRRRSVSFDMSCNTFDTFKPYTSPPSSPSSAPADPSSSSDANLSSHDEDEMEETKRKREKKKQQKRRHGHDDEEDYAKRQRRHLAALNAALKARDIAVAEAAKSDTALQHACTQLASNEYAKKRCDETTEGALKSAFERMRGDALINKQLEDQLSTITSEHDTMMRKLAVKLLDMSKEKNALQQSLAAAAKDKKEQEERHSHIHQQALLLFQ